MLHCKEAPHHLDEGGRVDKPNPPWAHPAWSSIATGACQDPCMNGQLIAFCGILTCFCQHPRKWCTLGRNVPVQHMSLLFSGLYLMAWEPKDLHGPSSPGEAPRTYTEHCGEDLCNKPRISVELVGHALRSDPGSDLQRLLSLFPALQPHTHRDKDKERHTLRCLLSLANPNFI